MNILRDLEQGVIAPSAEATVAVASRLAEALPPDAVLGLSGELGAGKTTFVKGLAAAWNIPGIITSPTYNIFTVHNGLRRQLVHMDAYRLERGDDVDALMLEEFLRSPYCVAVEWPENVADWMPHDALRLRFTAEPKGGRIIRLEKPGR